MSGLEGVQEEGPLRLDAYQAFAIKTNRSELRGGDRLRFVLLGLFGEVGSLLSELKKKQRDHNAYQAYAQSAHEETGDVLWYLANVAEQLGLTLNDLAADGEPHVRAASRSFIDLQPQHSLFEEPASNVYVQRILLRLAAQAGGLVDRASASDGADHAELAVDLRRVFAALVNATTDAHISLDRAAQGNIAKILDRWPLERRHTDLFDSGADSDEQLPRRLEVLFREKEVRGVAYVFQSVHGINLGDRLTDNRADPDNYRFHDVFHLAYAAVLGWSPVLRALLKLKRKSNPQVDETQDGARAILTEEGISNWVFAHGLRHNAFEGVETVDLALLRSLREMVRGYEAEACPTWMWEEAILTGFRIFRELRAHRGGLVIANLEERTLTFEAPR
jgi:NTP pyrophosphatase (non-canonical NTP hydrolase)